MSLKRYSINLLFILLGLVISINSIAAQKKRPTRVINRPERLLLVTYDWYPFHYKENGEIKGNAMRQMQCIMKVMKQPYQITMTTKDKAKQHLAHSSQHAFFLSAPNIKQDETAIFSTPLTSEKWSWFSLSDAIDVNSAVFKTQAEVGAVFGSDQWYWLQKHGYRALVKPQTSKALVALLLSGQVGAILGSDKVIDETIQDLGISPAALSKKHARVQPLGLYFSKSFTTRYPLYVKEFNQASQHCKSN